MAVGIEKTLEVFDDISVVACEGIAIAKQLKGGFTYLKVLACMGKFMAVAKACQELVKDAPAALPELQDLDAAESAKIGAASYALVRKVMEEIAK